MGAAVARRLVSQHIRNRAQQNNNGEEGGEPPTRIARNPSLSLLCLQCSLLLHGAQLSNIGEEGGKPRKRNPVKTLSRVDVVELGTDGDMPAALRIEVGLLPCGRWCG